MPIEIDIKRLSAEKTRKLEAFSGRRQKGDPCDTLEEYFVPLTEEGGTAISQGGPWSEERVF